MEDDYDVIACPHCGLAILVYHAEICCTIFRHGALRNSGVQLPPHLGKEECDALASQGLIWGCGRPFRWTGMGEPEVCGYI